MIVGFHCLVVWQVEQLVFDWMCRLLSGWSRIWHRMHCAEALSFLWSKLACCSAVVAAFAAGVNSTAKMINNNLFMVSRVPVLCLLWIHSPASAHPHPLTLTLTHPASHTHVRVVLIPHPFCYSPQF